MRIARWSTRLLPFTYSVRHKPGSLNVVANALSRLPTSYSSEEDYESEMVVEISSNAMGIKYDEIVAATKNCPVKVLSYIQNGWPVNAKRMEDKLVPFFRVRYELATQNDCVIRGTHRIVLPETLQARLVSLAHENHQGIVRTKMRLRELYWWPGMDSQVEAFIKHCSACQSMNKTLSFFNPPLQPVPYPSAAWEKLGIDIVGPLPGAPCVQRFAITLIDYYSKWPEVLFCSHVTTKEVTNFLNDVFSREGYPREIVTDNGKQFTSHEFKCFQKNGAFATANGEIERFNKVFRDYLQMAYVTHRRTTDTVRDFLMTYRSTPHCVTGATPSLLLHGRTLRTKLHPLVASRPVNDRAIREKVTRRQEYLRRYVNDKKKRNLPHLSAGDVVYTRQPSSAKGHSRPSWQPTIIQSQVREATYRMADGRVWNASNLARR
ncbi:zf-H2C2 and rve domain containing protein [Trichuris trichiura]|uniref:RNA-directed DNA polymerase n=1 Tax=Trichuris trichiura TaxID=36087 RepID=A0A077ZNF0_TRITR|nr:zf-H2C2 and rve domain containing protein [Trichuris trichiura]